MKARMHAFVALMLVSMGAGLFSGMPLDKIAETMQKAWAARFLAIVVALGAMFGKILHETGAVDQIAIRMLKTFGERRAHYAMGIAGLICALPLFFEVAVVLLISIAFAVARRTHDNLVKLVIPLFAGVAAAAAFLPGPAPMLLAAQMHADFGWMILLGLCAAIPGMLIAGPLFGNLIARHVTFSAPPEDHQPDVSEGQLPSFGFSLSLILFPLLLVGLKTIGARFTTPDSRLYAWLEFIGHPFTAILLALLVAIYGRLTVRAWIKKGDAGMRQRAAAGGDYPAGDWCGRRVQAGAGGFRCWPGAGPRADRCWHADCAGLFYSLRRDSGDSGLGHGGLFNHRRAGDAGD